MKRPAERHWSSRVAKMAKQAAKDAFVSYVSGGVSRAVSTKMKKAFSTTGLQTEGDAGDTGGTGSGVWRGSFRKKRTYRRGRKMRKARVVKKRRIRKYRYKKKVDMTRYGIAQQIEEYGSVDDNDAVYIINPVANDGNVINTLCMSLVKKLLKMGIKWDCPSVTEEILYGPSGSTISPAGLFINLYGGNPASAADGSYDVLQTYSMVNGDTVYSVAQQFRDRIRNYSAGFGLFGENYEIYSMVLGCNVRNSADTGTLPQILSTIYLDDEVVHWKGSSKLKIQNRTNSVGSSTSTDVNDSKPLEGYVYNFRGLPRFRVPFSGELRSINNRLNTKTFGAIELPTDFKEPPPMKLFSNCYGRQRIRLDPGQIKYSYIYGSGSMQLKPFLKKLNAQDDSLTFESVHTMFKTQMIALEECINSTDVNAVKCGFENSVYISVTCETKPKRTVTQPYNEQILINEST